MVSDKLREIEEENEELIEELVHPFNPKDIDIAVESRSLDSIISRIKHSAIDMNTHFQRKGDLWADNVMSRLIESILIRFPLPAFYFDASNEDSWLIVDGLQRLSAIRKFVLNTDEDYVRKTYNDDEKKQNRHKPLVLVGLEYLKEFEGLTYDQLPNQMKRRLNESQVTVYLIKPGTPEDVKYSIFYRINTGGLQLNAQEIRHALNQNYLSAKFLEDIGDDQRFKKYVKISDKRMQDRELVLRYIAFTLVDYKNYKPSMSKFLNNAMSILNTLQEKQLMEIKENLFSALFTANYIFRENVFSKSLLQGEETKGPLNRGLFEAWTVLLSKLGDRELDILQQNREEVVYEFKNTLKNNDFVKSITSSTTGANQVRIRFEAVQQIINKLLHD